MNSSGGAKGASPTDHNFDGPEHVTRHALAGALMCVVAVVLVGAILIRTAPRSASELPADAGPTSQPRARAVTAATRARAATAAKKHPRATVATSTTTAPSTASTTVPTTASTRVPTPVVQVRTPATKPPVVQAAATPPPTTPPRVVAVPYTPPTQKPPDSVAVPFVPTSIPSG